MKMKLLATIVGAALLCGCANQYYVGPSGPNSGAIPLASGPMTLVNNTPCTLNVTIDSVLVYTNVAPGQTVAIHGSSWVPRTPVIVTGYDEKGRYQGANDWIFYNGQAQVWRVDKLHSPDK